MQPPRGLGYSDARGTYNGSDKEVYHLGDFRYYNHSAITPYCNFPAGIIEYGSSVSSATGLSRTVYVGEMDWKQTSPEHNTENDWSTQANVHLLNASDDSIEGTAAIPASGGNVDISVDDIPMPTPGATVTVTYHVAFGIDATHWSFKMGTDQGLGGIGTIQVRRGVAPTVSGAIFIDTSFGGGANDPYSSVQIIGSNTNRINGSTQAIWDYSTLDAWRCYHSSGTDDYRNINADWYIRGFHESPSTEYLVGNANVASNGANNTVDLSTMSATPPHSSWEDGDNMVLVLRNLTINF